MRNNITWGKSYIIIAIVLASLILLGTVFGIKWYYGDNNDYFYEYTTEEFEIPGLDEYFVPQGMAYDSNAGAFLISGYMSNGDYSRMYMVYDNGDVLYFHISCDGQVMNGHLGGVATNGTYFWVPYNNGLCRLDCQQLLTVSCGDIVEAIDNVTLHNRGDFVTVDGNYIWMGEFYFFSHPTDENNHFATPNGDYHYAVSYCYEIDNDSDYGLASTTPVKALSTTDKVQGMVIIDDTVILSTSCSVFYSHIYTYEIDLYEDTPYTIALEGNDIPLYIMDSYYLVDTLTTPSMSEDMIAVDGKLYILYECAALKYSSLRRELLTHVYSYPL